MRTHFDRVAEVALDLLLAEGSEGRIERVMPTLIPRSSTAPLAR